MKQPLCRVIAHHGSLSIRRCLEQLARHGWSAQAVPAVEGYAIQAQCWQDIGVALLPRGKMPDRSGAQGCWFSHWGLWRECEHTQQPMIIMEHDALVQAPWPGDLDIDTHMIKLYRTAPCKHNTITGTWSKGSHAYTLTPAHATVLIQHARENGAQALDKHLGDQVVPWRFLGWDLVTLDPGRGPSSTTRRSR